MLNKDIYRMNRWNGGLSDDKFSGLAGSFQSGEGLEIRNNPLSLKLQKEVKEHTINGTAKAFLTLRGDLNSYCITDTGYVYTISSTGAVTTLRTNLTTGVQNAIEWDSTIYLVTDTDVYSLPSSSFATGTPTDIGNIDSGGNKKMVVFKEFLFLTGKDFLYQYDGATFNSLQLSDDIISISPSGNYMKVYYGSGNDTIVAFVDIIYEDNTELKIKETKTWDGAVVRSAINKDGLDYLLMDSGLYISQGFTKQLIKKTTISPSLTIAAIDNIIYFGGGNNILSYGSLNKDYAEVLNVEATTSGDVSVMGANGQILLGGGNTKLYVHNRNGSTYQLEGRIKSRVYYGNSVIVENDAVELRFGHTPLPINTSITVNVYTNLDTVAEFSYTTTSEDDMFIKLPLAFSFNLLEVEVVLNSSNGVSSPELLDLMIYFGDTKN